MKKNKNNEKVADVLDTSRRDCPVLEVEDLSVEYTPAAVSCTP